MVQPTLTGLGDQKPLPSVGFMKSMAWITLQTSFHFFKTVIKVLQCVLPQNEAVNQLKANFIYRKAARVSLDYTHHLAVCAHFEKHLPPSLWIMVLQTSERVYHLSLW